MEVGAPLSHNARTCVEGKAAVRDCKAFAMGKLLSVLFVYPIQFLPFRGECSVMSLEFVPSKDLRNGFITR